MARVLVIAGVSSGVGKTTITLGLDDVPAGVPRVYRVRQRRGAAARAEGYLVGRALMSYVYLHFGSAPGLAEAFVAACAS